MKEFNNRISAQREILRVINSLSQQEDLFGLSSGAISRWVSVNNLDKDSRLVSLVFQAADKLFFLANKSQEQITNEYKVLSQTVAKLTDELKLQVIQLNK